MSKLRTLASDTVIYGLGAILPKLVGFLLIGSWLTYQLGPDLYGIYGVIYAYVTLALVLLTLRMETAFFKYASDASQDVKKVYDTCLSLVLTSSIICLGLVAIFHQSVASFTIGAENSRFILYFIAILFFDALAAVPFAKLRQEGRAWKFSIIRIANSFVTIALNLFLFKGLPLIPALQGFYNTDYLLDYTFIANLIGSVLVVILLNKEVLSFKFRLDSELIKSLLRFSWPLMVVGLAGATNQFADRIFIEKYTHSFDQAGLFTGAIKIAVIMNLFITAFNYAAEPFFFKNASKEARKSLYGSIALAFTICGMLIFLGVLVYIDLLQFIIDVSYREALYIVPIALLANFTLGLYYNVSIWYKLSGKTIYGALIATIGTIVFVTLSYFLIPALGIIGACYSGLSCFMVMVVLAYVLGKKHYPIHYPVGKILFYITLAVVAYYIFNSLAPEGLSKILMGSALMLMYAVIAYFLDFRKLKITAQ